MNFFSKKNCHLECKKIINERVGGVMRKIFNRYDPWGTNLLFFYVKHPKGEWKQHFVVQDGDKIIDPFLEGEFPADSYKQIYRNSDEIRIV